MEPDRELLRQYAEAGNQPAFAEVVRRHTDLVYSVALRLTGGDAHLAQDVAQKVFTTLAQKAGPLSRHASLAGWLHTTTRYAASATVRGEHRRRAREQEASTMQHQPATTEIDWMQLQPLLDEAVGGLRAADREAVLLRFFQNKSHREVGAELGWNESLTRKRIERALEKLRAHFAVRGVTVSSVALATTLAANSVQAAPVGLAANLAGASLAGAAHIGATVGFWKALTMTTKTKMALAAAVILGAAAIPVLESRQISQTEAQNYSLTKQNAALQAQVLRLGTQLRKIKNVALDPTLSQSADPNDYLPLSKETILGLNFGPFHEIFFLDGRTIGLLGMTPTEAGRVQDVLTTFKNRIGTRIDKTVHEVPAGQVTEQAVLDFQKKYPGRQSVFEIPPMSEADRAAQQQWLTDGLTDALGPERSSILFQKLLQNNETGYWLAPETRRIYAFSDSDAPEGQLPKSVGEVYGYTGHILREDGSLFNDFEGSHEEESDFVKALRNGKRPSPPRPPPAEPSNQNRLVLTNLGNIWLRAQDYMDRYKVTEVSYQQLIAGSKPLMEPIKPIVGENYEALVIHQGDTNISLQVPGEGLVTFDMDKSK